jgi:phage tail-like protein
MADATRTDPLRSFKFQVQIVPTGNGLNTFTKDIGKLGFASMSGPSVTNDLLAYREGGMNTHTHKMVGMSDFNAVSFVRGVFSRGDELWRWQQFIHAWEQGVPGGSTGEDGDYRCDIIVHVYDHPTTASGFTYSGGGKSDNSIRPGNIKLAMKFFNCWPGVFALGGLSAGESGILVQELTVHNEGFHVAFTDDEIAKLPISR